MEAARSLHTATSRVRRDDSLLRAPALRRHRGPENEAALVNDSTIIGEWGCLPSHRQAARLSSARFSLRLTSGRRLAHADATGTVDPAVPEIEKDHRQDEMKKIIRPIHHDRSH